jgi:putative membrane protein insertion efficiency factor
MIGPAKSSAPTVITAGPSGLMVRAAVALLRGYQRVLSPLLVVLFRSGCRFHPTCSEYAVQAFSRFGIWRGVLKTLRRLCRCHPFHPGGHDPLTF